MATHFEQTRQQCVAVADFARAQDGPAGRCELVRGTIVMEAYPGPILPAMVAAIALPIFEYLAEHPAGRCMAPAPAFALSFQPPTVRVPDVAFIRHERLERARNLGRVMVGHPQLAALIVTAAGRRTAVQERAADLLHAGTHTVWIVDPLARQIEVRDNETRVLRPGDVLRGEPVLPGFQCPVADVFA